jgi:hypothetical protein
MPVDLFFVQDALRRQAIECASHACKRDIAGGQSVDLSYRRDLRAPAIEGPKDRHGECARKSRPWLRQVHAGHDTRVSRSVLQYAPCYSNTDPSFSAVLGPRCRQSLHVVSAQR